MSAVSGDAVVHILQTIFKHNSFKSRQQENAVRAICKGQNDVFVSLPTGSGKSLCYQLPGILSDKMTIVISPLLALIKDQIDHMVKLKIPANTINSKMTSKERQLIEMDLKAVRPITRFLYITPEQLQTPTFAALLDLMVRSDKISHIAVDEAHCVSHWGHDFRKEYLRLGVVRDRYLEVPWVALTATASKNVMDDIFQSLRLRNVVRFKIPSFRANLYYDIIYKELIDHEMQHLKDYIKSILKVNEDHLQPQHRSCGIIYCRTRENVESVASGLTKMGIPTVGYHAGLRGHERVQAQDDWMSGKFSVISATISFGMGVDKGPVRFVVHWDMPQSIAAYYQESGRAGRDGLSAYCRLYYSRSTERAITFLLKTNINKAYEDRKVQARLAVREFERVMDFCRQAKCRHQIFADYFSDDTPNCENRCDMCKHPKRVVAYLEALSKIEMNVAFEKHTIAFEDSSDLYEGGREGVRRAQAEQNSDGSDNGYGASESREYRARRETQNLIQRELQLRKKNAEKTMSMVPSAQITRVKQALSTTVKITGLTTSIREKYLTFFADALKANYEACVNPEISPQQFIYTDFEAVAMELEYDCFTSNTVISLYRHDAARQAALIKKFTKDIRLWPALSDYRRKEKAKPAETVVGNTSSSSTTTASNGNRVSRRRREPNVNLSMKNSKQTSLLGFFKKTGGNGIESMGETPVVNDVAAMPLGALEAVSEDDNTIPFGVEDISDSGGERTSFHEQSRSLKSRHPHHPRTSSDSSLGNADMIVERPAKSSTSHRHHTSSYSDALETLCSPVAYSPQKHSSHSKHRSRDERHHKSEHRHKRSIRHRTASDCVSPMSPPPEVVSSRSAKRRRSHHHSHVRDDASWSKHDDTRQRDRSVEIVRSDHKTDRVKRRREIRSPSCDVIVIDDRATDRHGHADKREHTDDHVCDPVDMERPRTKRSYERYDDGMERRSHYESKHEYKEPKRAVASTSTSIVVTSEPHQTSADRHRYNDLQLRQYYHGDTHTNINKVHTAEPIVEPMYNDRILLEQRRIEPVRQINVTETYPDLKERRQNALERAGLIPPTHTLMIPSTPPIRVTEPIESPPSEDCGDNTEVKRDKTKIRKKITADTVIKHLMPHYKAGLIATKEVFKAMARRLSHHFMENPEDAVIRDFIGVVFAGKRYIQREDELDSFLK